MGRQRAALSIDFEFFSQIPAYRRASGVTAAEDVGEAAVDPLLDLFDRHDVTSTFFVVSEIAERRPGLVERLADGGHEIASHTRTHPFLSDLSAEERRDELAESKDTLERVTGATVRGFRAPSFDVTPDLFSLLESTGYRYDSSTIPCRSIPGWYGGEYREQRPGRSDEFDEDGSADVVEVPVSVMPALRLPLSGAWFRLLGLRYARLGVRLLARRGIAPVLYLHPWELVDLPTVDGVPRRVYYRTGDWTMRAVERLLELPFEFVSVGELAGAVNVDG